MQFLNFFFLLFATFLTVTASPLPAATGSIDHKLEAIYRTLLSSNSNSTAINGTVAPFEALEGRGLYCETTDGSPTIPDIAGATAKLDRVNTGCVVQNAGGSHCTRSADYGSAAIGVCGRLAQTLPCKDVAAIVADNLAHCAWNGKSGFHYNVDEYYTIIVYHN